MTAITLSELNRFDSAAFERWLSERLICLYPRETENSGGTGALDLSDLGISSRTGVGALTALFYMLANETRLEFQGAIGNLLRHARIGGFPTSGMRDLISLLATTRAHAQLPSLDTVLGAGEWGDFAPPLFHSAISALKTMRSGLEAYTACQRLITARRFPRVYIFDAYEVLIAGQPARWADDLVQLIPLMHPPAELLQRGAASSQRKAYETRFKQMIEALLSSVSAQAIVEGLSTLTQQIDYLSPDHPAGRTLHFLSTGVDMGKIAIDADTGRLVLVSGNSGIRHFLQGITATGELFLYIRCQESSDESRRPANRKKQHKIAGTREPDRDTQLTEALARAQLNVDSLSARGVVRRTTDSDFTYG